MASLFVAHFPALSGPACRTTARISLNHDDQQEDAGSALRVAAGHAGIEVDFISGQTLELAEDSGFEGHGYLAAASISPYVNASR